MKNQLHVYADEKLYGHCSMLADELGLSNSSYLKMLVSKAWKERKGGTEDEETVLSASVVPGSVLDLKHGEASKVSVGYVRYPKIGGRQRHKSKIQKE